MEIVVKAAQFIVCLSLLIIVHEFGHFLFSRLFKVRVEKFYLFFNLGMSVLRAKRINGKWQFAWFSKSVPEAWKEHPEKTEWGIGWLPLGGYCKIAGMIDESMDTEQMKQEPKPWEFRTKPAGQRLLIMVGGVLFNVIFAMLIYSGILFTWGENYIANKDVVYGVSCGPLADSLGMQNGDKVLAVGGEEIANFDEIVGAIVRDRAESITVERNGRKLDLPISTDFRKKLRKAPRGAFIGYRIPSFEVKEFMDESAAFAAGFKVGDKVAAIDGQPIAFFDEGNKIIGASKNKTINVDVLRGDSTLNIPVNIPESGLLGVYINTANDIKVTHVSYGFFESIPMGVVRCVQGIGQYIKNIQLILSPKEEAYKDVGGFIMIGSVFPGEWDWHSFWNLCALLSIMLAVVNILPVPMLDGGHVLFLLYEVVTRRKPSEKFLERAQLVGMVLIFGLIIFANGNDIIKLFTK